MSNDPSDVTAKPTDSAVDNPWEPAPEAPPPDGVQGSASAAATWDMRLSGYPDTIDESTAFRDANGWLYASQPDYMSGTPKYLSNNDGTASRLAGGDPVPHLADSAAAATDDDADL